jgi:hypothetical protein
MNSLNRNFLQLYVVSRWPGFQLHRGGGIYQNFQETSAVKFLLRTKQQDNGASYWPPYSIDA